MELGSADSVFAALLLLSVLIGLVRGFVVEAMALAGWLVAFAAAPWLVAYTAAHVPVGEAGSALNHAAAYLLCFVAVLVAWALIARVLRWLIRASALSGLDRVLGGAFGVARGLLAAMAMAVVVLLTPLAQSVWWQQSAIAPWAVGLVKGVRPLMPAGLQRWLPA